MPAIKISVKETAHGDTWKYAIYQFATPEAAYEAFEILSQLAHRKSDEKRDYILAKMVDKKVKTATGKEIYRWFYFSGKMKERYIKKVKSESILDRELKDVTFKEMLDVLNDLNRDIGVI